MQRKFKWNYLALAFAIPCVGMLFVMLVSQYEPFGKYSMLYSDMYHQYYPFFVAFRKALRSGDSLLYSWNVGMGMDYLGLISYYLASPLNLLSVLVPESLLLEFFSLLMPVKLGLAGLFFAIFLKKLFGKDDISISMFGALYALCAWALGFQWNIMWLDTFALLPLVALGTVSLIRDKKFILYTLTLFQSVYSNYYIGFFTCIFVLLLFFVYQICRWRGWKRFFADLCRIAFFSVLAIGMTAILELPALAALQTTQSSVNKFPTSFRLNIASEHTILGLLDAMRQVAGNMGGSLEPNFKEGLPNLYCGVGTILLAFLYLVAKDVKLRDKICAVVLLLFFNVSFIIRQLDYIWHGFHFTNMIPYRFSFLYSFVMLYMAYRAWLLRRKFRPIETVLAGILTAAVLCCSNDLLSTQSAGLFGWDMEIPVYAIYNGVFLVLYLVMLIWGQWKERIPEDAEERQLARIQIRRNRRRANARAAAMVVLSVEIIANLVSFGLWFPGTNVTNYPKGTDEAESMIRYMHEREEDTLFYRAETTHSQTLNDGALNGYNGVSTFTSSANVKTTVFMQALGYGAKNTYNRYCFEESSPVANLFLSLKYMIERDGRERGSEYFTDVHHYGKVHLLENNAYLPLGFLAESELADVDFSSSSGTFAFQNELFSAATGLEENVWHGLEGENLTITGNDVTIGTQNSSGYCSYSDCISGSNVVYSYVADRDGFLCIHLNLPKRNDFYVSVNGVELYKESISLPQMLAVGDVKTGDVIDIRIMCDAGESSTMTLSAAILDSQRFWAGYEVLNTSTLGLTVFENTYVEGIVDCDRDGLLYTSIPQNGNWSVEVDGEPAGITLVGDCMIGVELTEGYHTVSFSYHNAAFSLGWKITLGCFAVFALLVQVIYKPDWKKLLGGSRKKGKYQK
ncbi:MAG: YfhO family protein [Oscillospiraceae bacterium]|nr:YfhO family protein [Oscillospiraceae bacterium]